MDHCDTESDGRGLRTEVIEVPGWLSVQMVVVSGWAGLDDKNAESGVSFGEASCDDTAGGAS